VTVYSIDGKILPEEEARISVEDLSVIRGFGVFDYLRTYNRIPFRLKWHIDRFFNSAGIIGLKIKFTPAQVVSFVYDAIAALPDTECTVRLVQTGGVSPDSLTPVGNGRLNIIVKPAHDMPAAWYKDGATVKSFVVERFLPEAKTINYLMAIMAGQTAKAAGAIEAVYITRENRQVLEGATSNIAFIKDHRLIVPDKDILDGITMKALLDAAEKIYPIERRSIYEHEIAVMDEMILCSSNREVVPIVKFDDHIFGDGAPGPVSKDLMQIFHRETTNNPEES
jgi:branched-chain amino acid aminotransferase